MLLHIVHFNINMSTQKAMRLSIICVKIVFDESTQKLISEKLHCFSIITEILLYLTYIFLPIKIRINGTWNVRFAAVMNQPSLTKFSVTIVVNKS